MEPFVSINILWFSVLWGLWFTDVFYEQNYIKLAKSKILDLAIRGQLVPQDPMDSLQPLIEECKEKKYRLAIFEYGEQDLVKNTKDLLIHNRGLEKTDDTPKVMGLG